MNSKYLLLAFVSALSPQTLGATTNTVNNLNDSGAGSLRDAISASVAGDTINFSVNGTITLTTGALVLSRDLLIVGPGTGLLTISGNHASRVLKISGGAFNISALTIANGSFTDFGNANDTGGGGVSIEDADVTLNNCIFSGNNSETSGNGGGGAIHTHFAQVTINNCAFLGNNTQSRQLTGSGGAIWSSDSRLTVNNCTFSGNSPGALYDLTVTEAPYLLALKVNNSTLSNNTLGPAINIDNFHGNVFITSCTLADNIGGNLSLPKDGPPVFISNSIIAGHSDIPDDVGGKFTSLGHNLIGVTNYTSGWLPSDLTGSLDAPLPALLAPLRDNGGPTPTRLLLLGSPAINAGDDSIADRFPFDQRGLPRRVGAHVDIGACELGAGEGARPPLAVSNNNDSGFGSLRQAILDSPLYEQHTVTFDPTVRGRIVLTTGELELTTDVTILGPGAKLLTVDGNNSTRVFHVTATDGYCHILNLGIANGRSPAGGGGGISVEGDASLSISGCTVTNCYAAGSDAIANGGGGIYIGPGTLAGTPNVTIIRSTISGNSTPYSGGGLMLFNGNVSLENCTVSGNSTLDNSTAAAAGGGISIHSGALSIYEGTVANNSSAGQGGGIGRIGGTATLYSTLVANNTALVGPDCSGQIISDYRTTGYNLIGKTNGCVGFSAETHDLLGSIDRPLNPKLGPLQDNGGGVPTMALLAGSPAIDQGSSFGFSVDQRGQPRTLDVLAVVNALGGDGTDIGAFECAPSLGTVVAWGNNALGQTNPPAGLTGVVAIAGGFYHSVALRNDGTVVAWGLNGDGQTTVPPGLTNVVAIAAGGNQTIALKHDGSVAAWGLNSFGQTTVPSSLRTIQADADAATAIAAGYEHTVALRKNGTILAWGRNGNGEATPPPGLSGVRGIAAGNGFTLALTGDGTVSAWGYNNNGQTDVPPGLTGVVAIAAGYFHSVALKSDGTVVAWGYNGQGQTNVPAGLTGVSAIAASGDNVVALKNDGTVVEWGGNGSGQADVPNGLTGVTAVSAGLLHTLALIGADSPPAPRPRFSGTLTAISSGFAFGLTSLAPNQSFRIQSSTDLSSWRDIAILLATNSSMQVTLPTTTGSLEFYRVAFEYPGTPIKGAAPVAAADR